MRSQNDLPFHLRMAALLVFGLLVEQLATTHLPHWSSPRIGLVPFAIGLVWVALFAWQGDGAAAARLRSLEGRLRELEERLEALELERRQRRGLPPL
ncbi:MAG: hypothetical protein JNK49_20030 [Planctomycetes bacterium]|nr:hypothetical protein [Planctomycetota bacterium]